MAKTDFRTVDDYLATQPAPVRAVLERVRGAIRKALPRAEETISYQMPAYKVDGAWVLAFAGWKEHVSLYPFGAAMFEEFGDEVKPYVASKGTLRFPLAERVPLRLIGRLAKFRAAEAVAKQRAKRAAKKDAKPASPTKPRAKPAARARARPTSKRAAKRR